MHIVSLTRAWCVFGYGSSSAFCTILEDVGERNDVRHERLCGRNMFSGQQIVEDLNELDVTHVVWIPDSTLGEWDPSLRASDRISLINVCREGEAWAVAAGLYLGGARPLVVIQCTGLFESGDSLRNAVHDYRLPLFAIIGYRSFLNQDSLPGDTALTYTEPVLKAWDIDYQLIEEPSQRPLLKEHYCSCQAAGKAGAILFAEGKA